MVGSGAMCAQRDDEGCSNGMALGSGATESRASTSEPEPEDEDALTGVIADMVKGSRTDEQRRDSRKTDGERGQRPRNDGRKQYLKTTVEKRTHKE
jgi:hypothetical protein